ncbi:divergent protein kinase domain 1C isoform X2 [Hippocampus zosterae]|nr:divergent protein kinase domain 1C isoform X2 [Hippocampus zosterae]XP_051910794.1 divergent protein kinase domain 1C isoform X2 [Hippocampus zosterae]XP_051910795.1 divergent protein kinase domain 1C isoform X2 [Hippocampus zosterae]
MLSVRVRWRRVTLALLLAWLVSWLVLSGLLLLFHVDFLSDSCTDTASKEILHRLCGDFAAGSAAGDMCADLCLGGLVEYKRCLYYRSGKKVMEVRWRGRPVILKSKLENLSSYQPLGALNYPQDATEDSSPLDILLSATVEVRRWLGLTEEGEDDNDKRQEEASSLVNLSTSDKVYSRGELTSLWSLLQQDEYTFLRVLQDLSAHVSKVLGSCGHFYAVESLSAGHAWDQNIFSLDQDQTAAGVARSGRRGARAARHKVHRIALSFLDMVQHFDHDFTHKVHLCDVKPENFAIRNDLTVVAIDVDMAFFQPKMEEILDQKCSSDDDCNFFDCVSSCDLSTRRCRGQRANTNLQVICEKIFRLWFSPTLLGAKAGLPLQVELQRTVQECSESGGVDKRGQGESWNIHRRLFDILTRLVHEEGTADEGQEESKDPTPLNF